MKTRAETKLGELTAAMPKAKGARTDLTLSSQSEEVTTKAEALEKVNINRNQASQYELMAANPEIVEQVIQVIAEALKEVNIK